MSKFLHLIFVLTIPAVAFSQISQLPGIPSFLPTELNSALNQYQTFGFANDEVGNIYVATQFGVQYFGDKGWTYLDVNQHSAVSGLVWRESQNRLYVGGFGIAGFFEFKGDSLPTFQQLPFPDDSTLRFQNIWYAAETDSSVLFSSRPAIYEWKNDDWNIYYPKTAWRYPFFVDGNTIVSDAQGGIYRLHNGQTQELLSSDDFQDPMYFAEMISDDEILIGTRNNNFYTFTPSKAKIAKLTLNFPKEWYAAQTYVFKRLSDGNLAVGTLGNGVFVVDENFTIRYHFSEQRGLINNNILGLHEDINGNLYVATLSGISTISYAQESISYSKAQGLDFLATDVAKVEDNLLFTSFTGTYLLSKNTTGKVVSKKLIDGAFDNLFSKKHEILFVGKNGLYSFNRKNETVGLKRTLSDIGKWKFISETQAVFSRNTDIVWIDFVNGDEVVLCEMNSGVRSLKWMNNRLWILGNDGTVERYELNDGKVQNLMRWTLSKDQFEDTKTFGDFATFEGKEYVLNAKGPILLQDSTIPRRELLFRGVVNDTTEQIWKMQSLDAHRVFLRRNTQSYIINRFEDEWRIDYSASQSLGVQNSTLAKVLNDTLLIEAGPSAINISHIGDQKQMDSLKGFSIISSLVVDGDSLVTQTHLPKAHNFHRFEKPVEAMRFTFYSTVRSGEGTRFQVRMKGYQEEWSEVGAQHFKDYTGVREGRYTFEVRSVSKENIASIEDSMEFMVLPPWYRTWWAYGLYGLMVLSFFYILYRIRLAQFLKMERLRLRLAGDLHDEVSATLSSISFFAQAIESEGELEKRRRFVHLISESASDAKSKISDIIWAINPENDDWSSFLLKMHRFAQDTLTSLGISHDINILENISGELNMQVRQQLWMMYKEMLTNAARHSKATHITVHLSYKREKLRMVIADDGIGVDVEEYSEGNGLKNIRRRAESIDAKVKFDSAKGAGTRWELELNV